MSMNKTAMAALMYNAAGIGSDDGLDTREKKSILSAYEDLSASIIQHIQAAAVVSTNNIVESVSGVTVGAGTSGPGKGTGIGKVS